MGFLPGIGASAGALGIQYIAPAYIGQDDGENVNATHTFSGLVPVRTQAQRYVVALSFADPTARTIDSVTVAGVTATSRVAQAVGSESEVVILDALLAPGAAGDVVVDLSGANGIDALMVSLYTVGAYAYRASGADTGTDTASLAGIAVNANEYAIGVVSAFSGLGAGSITWTNLTERDDVAVNLNRISSASIQVAAAGTLTVTAASSSATEITAVVAVYAP